MPDYSVELMFRSDAGPLTVPDTRLEKLLDELRRHHAIVTVGRTDISVRVTVASADPIAALPRGRKFVQAALEEVSVASDLRLIEVDVVEADILQERNERPPERFLGLAEVAELFGVSKQRVSELRATPRFPAPIAELASGPVWTAPALGRFLESWERKPGRPRKAVAS